MEKIEHDPAHDVRADNEVERNREDEHFIRLAIEQARIGKKTPGGGEVGCVIVERGTVIAVAHNEAELRSDPTAHAEIVALQRAGAAKQVIELRECTVYCTLQCCTMCTAACIWAKVKRIVYGATRNDVHSMYFDAREMNVCDLIAGAFKDDIELVGGVLATECAQLYAAPDEGVPIDAQPNR